MCSRVGTCHTGVRVAYTFARNRFVDDADVGGNMIPGQPEHLVQAELRYAHPTGVSLALSVEWVPKRYPVNSENTAFNGAWATLGLRAEWTVPSVGLAIFAAARNLTGTVYSASVQVDSDAGRCFEPADGRSFYGRLRWSR